MKLQIIGSYCSPYKISNIYHLVQTVLESSGLNSDFVKLSKMMSVNYKCTKKADREVLLMSYFLKVTEPENASGQLQDSYAMLQMMFQTVPKVFVAQSIRPDLLQPIVQYVNRLMIETHALPRVTKELIAAYVSKLNACVY